ncbi:hypothetical protein [Terrisporobacter hibernicus]|uniref:Uncharacterized protein n=1 Tax=Terrisporobacter hibernicus TaxID=2813371 RepID=A0AAX2ZE38_9FIRM|nr:hypothetical protein [Terrisporobacter hibernicus]UEL47594.1 hypothetical protein JW646_18545 [Terrisporobacter hibernicus]
MNSFTDIKGFKVIMQDDADVEVDTITDIVSEEITDYMVYVNNKGYQASKEVYDAVKKKYKL